MTATTSSWWAPTSAPSTIRGWTYNLDADPNAEIVVGEETMAVIAGRADTATFDRLWPALVTVYAGMTKYRERLDREAWMYLLHPTAR